MLEVKNINLDLGKFKIKNLSLSIDKGEYHVLIGPSGSGKTLLLNIIAGFRKKYSGEIFYMNNKIDDIPPNKRKISFLFQDLALFPHLNVKKNIEYPLKIMAVKKEKREKIIDEYLKFAEISHLKNRDIQNLSGGEKQRVAIVRSLVTGNKLLLLDEPFSAIDTQLILSLKKLLKKISAEGVSIIHVTHNFEEAVNMGHRISVIQNGSIQQSGSIEELLKKPGNKFSANFSGLKNYFSISKLIKHNNITYAALSRTNDKATSDILKNNLDLSIQNKTIEDTESIKDISDENILIEISPENNFNYKSLIIDSKHIQVSKSLLDSSAKNKFEAYCISTFATSIGYDIEVYCGINLWISLTKTSFENMEISEGSKLYISFKATSVQLQ